METLTLRSRASDPFAVFEVVGELDLHTQGEFEEAVSRQLVTSPVIVDLSGVEFLAISALRSLMVCHGIAGAEGRPLFYAGPTKQTVRLLSVAGSTRPCRCDRRSPMRWVAQWSTSGLGPSPRRLP